MLGKVFGTPETARRVRAPRNEDDDLTSGDSTTSFGPTDEDTAGGRRITRPRSATVSAGLQRSTKSDTNVRSSRPTTTEREKEVKMEPAPPAGRSRAKSFDGGSSELPKQESDNDTTSPSYQSESRPTSIELNANSAPSDKHHQLKKRLSDSQLEAGRERKSKGTPTALREPVTKDLSKSRGGRTSSNQPTSPTRTGGDTSVVSRPKKRPVKALPTPRPVSAKPSTALKRLAEQKKEEADLEATAMQQSQTDGTETSGTDMVTKDDTVEANHLQNGNIEGEPSDSDRIETTKAVSSNTQNSSKIEGSPAKKKTLPVCCYHNNYYSEQSSHACIIDSNLP